MAKEPTPEEKRYAQRAAEADARYGLNDPCMHCKHIVSVGEQFSNKGWTCKAFPEQILYNIWAGKTPHTVLFASQVGDYKYEPVIYTEEDIGRKWKQNLDGTYTEEDTGRQWHYNADGTWKYR